MMPAKVDIVDADRFFVNTDFLIKFAIKQADQTTAQVITGWALSWKLKRRQSDLDVDAVVAKATGSGISITDGPTGLCQVAIADSDTVSLKSGVYMHELKRTDEGFESVLCAGTVILKGSVHKS